MREGAILVLVLASILAGCANVGTGSGGNPNLIAPKLVIQPRLDGNVTLFIHGAFRDQSYDWIAISVDNATVSNRSGAFSTELDVAGPGFFLHAQVHDGAQHYETRARVDVDAQDERVRVAFLEEDGWSAARPYGIPFEHILDRPKVSS